MEPASYPNTLLCRLDVPEALASEVQYAVRMLFLPFRLDVQWLTPADEDPEGGGHTLFLYYGPDAGACRDATIRMIHNPASWDWLKSRPSSLPPHRFVRVGEERIPVFFDADGDVSFDPVLSVFLWLSGWQETVRTRRDEHGRFPFAGSMQDELGIQDQPTVDWIRHIICDVLKKRGHIVARKTFGSSDWAFCATHDIDYIRKWRPGIYKREVLDRAVLNQAKESGKERLQRITRAAWSFFEKGDPFRDAIARIEAVLEHEGGHGTFFYKGGAHGFRDVGYALSDPIVASALNRQRGRGHAVGLHPSYHAYTHPDRLAAEKRSLESASGSRIRLHRAHYLRYDHPQSGHRLVHQGLDIDSSLGWSDRGGFRFGTCLPFPLFDPVAKAELALWEVPLVAMESALFNRAGLDMDQAIARTVDWMRSCASFGGVFTGLWHNTLWDEVDYPGWGGHFEACVRSAKREGAALITIQEAVEDWS